MNYLEFVLNIASYTISTIFIVAILVFIYLNIFLDKED